MDDVFHRMDERERLANESIVDPQKAITYGNYVAKFFEMGGLALVVAAYVRTLEEIRDDEIRLDAPEWEADEVVQMTKDAMARGYLPCMAYSIIESEGELGSIHKAECFPISEETFEALKRAGWKRERLTDVEAGRFAGECNEVLKHYGGLIVI